jgi:DNA replication protein DnaC
MGTVQIKNLLEDLHLKGMLRSFDSLKSEATKESWTADELLDRLLHEESEFRAAEAQTRRVKNSKLEKLPRPEDFDYTVKRSITKAMIKELYELRWLEQGRAVLLVGPTGIGKSFIAEALGHHACLRNKCVLFIGMSDLLEHLALARSAGQYLKWRAKMAKPDVLIVDDFGLRKLLSQEAHDFVDLLKARTGEKSTVFTTQVPLENWPELIEDPVIADTVIDRLKHTSVKIDLDGDTYRAAQGAALDKLK